MSCASCDQARRDGLRRCSVCGGLLVPPVEGALAPDPDSGEVVRELPGWRRRERAPSWKDEVRDRVRRRRRQRVKDASLPLFPEDSQEDAAAAPAPESEPERAQADAYPESALDADADLPLRPPSQIEPSESWLPPEPSSLAEAGSDGPDDAEEGLPSPPAEPKSDAGTSSSTELSELDARLTRSRPLAALPDLDFIAPDTDEEPEEPAASAAPVEGQRWSFSLPPPPSEQPLERPAQALERAQAAVLDLGLLVALWLVVVYFAARAAAVPMDALASSWPYLTGYLAFLGLAYATYFTSATGQTPGKQAIGLRVLGPGSRPPSARRALGRSVLGVIGVLAAGTGLLPLLFDPARRALHDRLAGTRVVRR